MKYWAVDCRIGGRQAPVGTLPDLDKEFTRLGIERAVVSHERQVFSSVSSCNVQLLKELQNYSSCTPCVMLTPDGEPPDFSVSLLIKKYCDRGIKLALVAPLAGGYPFLPWCCEEMLSSLSKYRLPILMEYAQLNATELDQSMQNYPDLRVILTRIPHIGRNHIIETLLRRHENLYLTFSSSFSVHGDYYQNLCSRYGESRWVFGINYPSAEPGASITGLSYSSLSENQQMLIASGNLQRLISEVKNG